MALDVIEKLNMLISANGNVINSEIVGKVVALSHLSGMPECKLGINDKTFFD